MPTGSLKNQVTGCCCSLTTGAICCPLALDIDLISACAIQRMRTHVRLPACQSMDVLCAVTYRMKPYCTVDSQNINGASFCPRDARLATPFLSLWRTLCRTSTPPTRASWNKPDHEAWSSPVFFSFLFFWGLASSGGAKREPRRARQEAVEGGKARFRFARAEEDIC